MSEEEVGTTIPRTARKVHTCCDCGNLINKGTRYAEVKTGVATSDRHCWTCAENNGLVSNLDLEVRACPWCGSSGLQIDGPTVLEGATKPTLRATVKCNGCTRTTVIETGDPREFYARNLRALIDDL